jgi:hypothetical protein
MHHPIFMLYKLRFFLLMLALMSLMVFYDDLVNVICINDYFIHHFFQENAKMMFCCLCFSSLINFVVKWILWKKSLLFDFDQNYIGCQKTLYNSSSIGCFGLCFDHNRFWLFGHQTFWLVPITSLSFWRRLISHSRKNNTRSLCQFCLRCLKED